MSSRLPIPKDIVEDLFVNQKYTITSIADKFSCGPKVISRRLKEWGILNKDERVKYIVDRDGLEDLYLHKGYTVNEIAGIYKCPQSRVYKWFKRFGIPIKKRERKVFNTRIIELMREDCGEGWKKFSERHNLNYASVRNIAGKYGIESKIIAENRDIPRGKYSKPAAKGTYSNIGEIPGDFGQVLLGSLLGDGGLFLPKSNYYPYYVETHCTKQKDYLLWKMNFFNPFQPRFYVYPNNNQVSFTTRAHPYFVKWYDLFYLGSKKKLRESIIEYISSELNILGLAIWYMDDGYISFARRKLKSGEYNYYRRINFSTNSLDNETQILTKRIFKEKFGFDITFFKPNEGTSCFYLRRRGTEDFIKKVKPHIHKNLRYKIRDTKNIIT